MSTVIITLLNGFYASYQVQRQQLISHALNSNLAYATKLAATTNDFLKATQQQLAYSARISQNNIQNISLLNKETERLQLQTDSFNYVVAVDSNGYVLAASTNIQQSINKKLTSIGAVEALKTQKPTISTPYISAENDLLIFISHPMFDPNGRYIGYIGGAIYLKKRSILNTILDTHYYEDGSYIYVVDKSKRIIYHPDKERVGTQINSNTVINRVLEGKIGTTEVINSKNIEMLAGYAPITQSQWGVVVQRPLKITLSTMNSLMIQVIYRSIPLGFITFIAIWLLSRFIAQPLQQLANTAKMMDNPMTITQLKKIDSWYFECTELKQAMLKGVNLLQTQISQLRHAASTDPLTGVYNRRSLDLHLEELEKQGHDFTILAVDIDHFKYVNDTYGHSAGDMALIHLTQKMTELSRKKDIIARTGGEEFLIVLPETPINEAYKIAEHLRIEVSEMKIGVIGSIYISIGIANSTRSSRNIKQALREADTALYQAKKNGRNRCIVYHKSAPCNSIVVH